MKTEDDKSYNNDFDNIINTDNNDKDVDNYNNHNIYNKDNNYYYYYFDSYNHKTSTETVKTGTQNRITSRT